MPLFFISLDISTVSLAVHHMCAALALGTAMKPLSIENQRLHKFVIPNEIVYQTGDISISCHDRSLS
jgi:hypothetical protein